MCYFCPAKRAKTMRYLKIVALIVAIINLYNCGGGKILTETKQRAEVNFVSGNYDKALADYESIINIYSSNSNSDECPVYTKAGIAAFNTGDYKKSIEYLKKDEYSKFKTSDTFFYLARAYSKIDNLSLEMLALQDYISMFPDGMQLSDVKERLYILYVDTDNYDKALELWPDVSRGDYNDVIHVESYFSIYDNLKNIDSCNVIAKRLLNIDEENETALFWFGEQYYRKAEDRYQMEMSEYNKNKTNKQYKKLLNALEVVTDDFKRSLGYFKKLYKSHPKPEYANYLSYIYNRLGDETKANFYKSLSK